MRNPLVIARGQRVSDRRRGPGHRQRRASRALTWICVLATPPAARPTAADATHGIEHCHSRLTAVTRCCPMLDTGAARTSASATTCQRPDAPAHAESYGRPDGLLR